MHYLGSPDIKHTYLAWSLIESVDLLLSLASKQEVASHVILYNQSILLRDQSIENPEFLWLQGGHSHNSVFVQILKIIELLIFSLLQVEYGHHL
jgi:hypothetical protein